MRWLFFLLLIAGQAAAADRSPVVVVDRVDVVEVNHFYDGQGKLVFCQILWWEWRADEDGSAHRIVDWRLMKSSGQLPVRVDGVWRCQWTDGERLRRVDAWSYRETWTQEDPELVDRLSMPPDQLRKLSEPVFVGGEDGNQGNEHAGRDDG